jgi:hypothetical protein
VLTVGQEEEVTFYIHKSDHVLSQFPKPDESSLIDYNEVNLPSQNVMNLLQKHGDPFYVKVDLENYDQVILKELFLNGIRPNFISGESHSIEIFSLLVGLGNYRSFNIVDGRKISSVYKKHSIETEVGKELYSFPFHSAGPFGKDIKGDWMTADNFFRLLAFKGLGWRDIHATNEIQPNLEATVSNLKALRYQASYVFNQTKDALRNRAPSFYNTLLRIKRLIAP